MSIFGHSIQTPAVTSRPGTLLRINHENTLLFSFILLRWLQDAYFMMKMCEIEIIFFQIFLVSKCKGRASLWSRDICLYCSPPVQSDSLCRTDRHCEVPHLTCVWNRRGPRQLPHHGHVRSQADGGLHEHVPGHTEEQEAPVRRVCHQGGANWCGDGKFTFFCGFLYTTVSRLDYWCGKNSFIGLITIIS